jgi:hypothetical protein
MEQEKDIVERLSDPQWRKHDVEALIEDAADEIERLRAQDWMLNTMSETRQGEWLPIETAPKDDSEILTFTPPENHHLGVICGMHVGFWSQCLQEWRQSDLEWEINPSHWQPLPQPPKAHP